MTSLLGWLTYLLRGRALAPQRGSVLFWALSAAGFFYLMLDESFQFQDVDPTNPSLFPERLISFRFTLAFE